MQKPDSTCRQRESNPYCRVSQPCPLHCGSASALAHWATEGGQHWQISGKYQIPQSQWSGLSSVLWHCWFSNRKSIWPIYICLEQSANELHIVQSMPLPPLPSSLASIESKMFLVPPYRAQLSLFLNKWSKWITGNLSLYLAAFNTSRREPQTRAHLEQRTGLFMDCFEAVDWQQEGHSASKNSPLIILWKITANGYN